MLTLQTSTLFLLPCFTLLTHFPHQGDETTTTVVPEPATTTPSSPTGPVPVVLWHGMGDRSGLTSYIFPIVPLSAAGMTGIAGILEEHIPGVYVHRIMIGGNLLVDTESGFFRDTNRQVDF